MSEGRPRSKAHVVGRAVLTVLIGILAGAGFNSALGEKGADTPTLALIGGAIALVVVLLQARRRGNGSQP